MRVHFTVITPTFNAGELLLETAESVLSQCSVQRGTHQVQYVVVDGGSTDGSIEQLRQRFPEAHVVSEADRGMYDAIGKGLRLAQGKIHSYLNAGDLLHPRAFDVVHDVMADVGCDWLTGSHFYCNSRGQVVGFKLPYRYRRAAVRRCTYGRVLPAVQQESVFWRSWLTDRLDLEALASYRLAGDSYMWAQFARLVDLYIVRSYIGGFTYHGNHLSDAMAEYRSEMARHAEPATALSPILDRIDWLVWKMPDRVKLEFNRQTLVTFDRQLGRWRTGAGGDQR